MQYIGDRHCRNYYYYYFLYNHCCKRKVKKLLSVWMKVSICGGESYTDAAMLQINKVSLPNMRYSIKRHV